MCVCTKIKEYTQLFEADAYLTEFFCNIRWGEGMVNSYATYSLRVFWRLATFVIAHTTQNCCLLILLIVSVTMVLCSTWPFELHKQTITQYIRKEQTILIAAYSADLIQFSEWLPTLHTQHGKERCCVTDASNSTLRHLRLLITFVTAVKVTDCVLFRSYSSMLCTVDCTPDCTTVYCGLQLSNQPRGFVYEHADINNDYILSDNVQRPPRPEQ